MASDDLKQVPDPVRQRRMPAWVRSVRSAAIEDAAFSSGAALATLHDVALGPALPHPLWRQRLALSAAEACVSLIGRPERASDLRDEVHLLRPGDQPGPAGAVFMGWQRLVARPLSKAVLQRALPEAVAGRISLWQSPGQGGPIAQAVGVLEQVLSDHPHEEAAALMLADAVLAKALSWSHVVPLIAAGLKSRDLRKTGTDLRLACHQAITISAGEAVQIASEVERGAARLRAVVPKLRSKGAEAAVEVFLSRDAVSPGIALSGILSDRSARRFCDRLVDLGAVRELTGRDTFRLYGV